MWFWFMLMLAAAEVWDIYFPRCVYSALGSRVHLTNFNKISRFDHVQVLLNMSVFEQDFCFHNVPACVVSDSNRVYCGIRDQLHEYSMVSNSWMVVQQLPLAKNFLIADESIKAMKVFESKLFVLGTYHLLMCELHPIAKCDQVRLFYWGNGHIVSLCNTDPRFWLVSWIPIFGIFREEVVFDLKCLAASELCENVVPDDLVESYCWLSHEWVDTRQTCK